MASQQPLIADYQPRRNFAWRDEGPVDCAQALASILFISSQLEPGGAHLNLCQDRYFFTLGFAAICLAGGVNLLPASHAAGALRGVREAWPRAKEIDDAQVRAWLAGASPKPPACVPMIESAHCAAVVFTSGSTGVPTAHEKFWGDLYTGTRLCQQRFFGDGPPRNVVATVPPQHMFGLETSVLPVLQGGFAAHAGRPAMPWEIAEALAAIPAPRVLMTTPVHLRACVRAGIEMPALSGCISATAPLSAELAGEAEALWNTEIHEIYGCTEAGSLASRRTIEGETWRLYEGMQLRHADAPELSGPQLPTPVPLSDELQLLEGNRFRLLGRAQEMLKVAGKRLSLGELNQRLLDIDGVLDAAAFLPASEKVVQRPAALVVAPHKTAREIAARLAVVIDPVFVPRPLFIVPALPRNAVGKLPRAALEELLQSQRKVGGA